MLTRPTKSARMPIPDKLVSCWHKQTVSLPPIAYLAGGKIRLKLEGESSRTIESQYGNTIRERSVKAQQRHSWKTEGSSFLSGSVLWGKGASDPSAIRITTTSLCRGTAAGQFLYALETDHSCGLLAVDNFGSEERRVWSNNTQRLRHISTHQGHVACSVEQKFGTANIGVMLADGSGLSEVTEGDSLDTAPRWVPGEKRQIVFQSAGVGRDRDGNFGGLGPFAIQKLDLDSGEMNTLVEDDAYDSLVPQMTADGTLYYIQRPHTTGREFSFPQFIKDFFLFPFRLLFAIFQYLNFFSMIYTGKKLTTAGGAKAREMDLKQMMIWGNMVRATNRPHTEAPDLVPNSWKLMRKREGDDAQELAASVLSYDVCPDGSIIYTNGSAIFHLAQDGKSTRLLTDDLIEQVAVLETPPQRNS